MKKFLVTIILLPIILMAGVIGFLKFADLNNYKPSIEKVVRKYAGVEVKINGDIDIAVSLKPTIELSDVDVVNISDKEKIAKIGSVFVQFAILPLFHKEVVVERVNMDNTNIFYNENESVLINELYISADDYSSPINISFDTTIAGTDISGDAEIDSLKQLKGNDYNQSNIKAQIQAMGYDLEFSGIINGIKDKLKADGNYELEYKNNKVFGDVIFSMEDETPYLKMNINGDEINIKDFTSNKQVSSNNLFISEAYAEEYIPNTDIPYSYLRMVNAEITLDVKQIKIDENIVLNDVKGDVSLNDGVLKSNVQNLKFKNNIINGKAEITSPKTLPYIKLNIKGDGFDVKDFTASKKIEKRSSINFDWLIGSANAAELSNSVKIPYQYLKMLNADITLNLNRIKYGNDMSFDKVSADITLNNGVLKSNIKNITAGNGTIDGNILLKSVDKSLDVNMKGTNIIIQELYKPFGQSDNKTLYVKEGGKITFDIKVKTFGGTINDYLSHSNGQIIAYTDDSVLSIKSLKKLQGNIIVQILDALKIKTSGGDMNLICGVMRGDVSQGVVKFPKGIALNADNFYLVADGKINLNNEKINLDLQPFSGKISDVNISSILGNLIKITGTLSNPKIGINQTATAKNVIGAIASGGMYNVGDLMLSADSTPCRTALKGTSYENHFKKDKTVSGNVSKGYNNTKDAIKGLGSDIKSSAKGIKKQIKGLFN